MVAPVTTSNPAPDSAADPAVDRGLADERPFLMGLEDLGSLASEQAAAPSQSRREVRLTEKLSDFRVEVTGPNDNLWVEITKNDKPLAVMALNNAIPCDAIDFDAGNHKIVMKQDHNSVTVEVKALGFGNGFRRTLDGIQEALGLDVVESSTKDGLLTLTRVQGPHGLVVISNRDGEVAERWID